MLNSIQTALSQIDILIKQTNAYKGGVLHGIKKKLESIHAAQDLDCKMLDNLAELCRELLQDKQFTYKSFSLFGILTSHSEQFARELITLLGNTHLLALEKIAQHHETFLAYKRLLAQRDYLSIFNRLCDAKSDADFNSQEAGLIAEKWLITRLEERIQLPDSTKLKRYPALLYPALEVNQYQRRYTITQLIDLVSSASENEPVSFTYAVDLNRNVIFSRGANTSYHYNLFQGADVYGAGEVHLRKRSGQIYLDIVNNRSGLYKPETELLESVVKFFDRFKVNVAHTQIKDEAEQYQDILLRQRLAY